MTSTRATPLLSAAATIALTAFSLNPFGLALLSPSMLSQTLQRLEADGLVVRTPHSTIPPRVDYDLSELGRPIAERICDLIETIYDQLPGIVAHQRARPDGR